MFIVVAECASRIQSDGVMTNYGGFEKAIYRLQLGFGGTCGVKVIGDEDDNHRMCALILSLVHVGPNIGELSKPR